MSAPVASVIIPAHNEQAVLRRCLDALLRDSSPGEFDVVVAANGCTDATVRIANDPAHDDVRVVETPIASKIAGLNLGDAAARGFPRIYLDADVVLATDAARELARALTDPRGPAAAAPRMWIEMKRSSWPARVYLQVWQSLPVFARSYVGSGCYALSAHGRDRFTSFPDLTNDDQFVNDLFAADEKLTLPSHHFVVSAPTSLRAIARRSTRVRGGAIESSGGSTASAGSTRAHLVTLARRPRHLPGVLVFVATQVLVRVMTRYRVLRGNREWLRDETSRTPM